MGGIDRIGCAHPNAAAGVLCTIKITPAIRTVRDWLRPSRRCRGRHLHHKTEKDALKQAWCIFFCFMVRKEWDSNPRYTKSVRRISSPVHSITLASFRVQNYNKSFVMQQKI